MHFESHYQKHLSFSTLIQKNYNQRVQLFELFHATIMPEWVGTFLLFFFSSRRRHTRLQGDWSSDVCSSDLPATAKSPSASSWTTAQTPWCSTSGCRGSTASASSRSSDPPAAGRVCRSSS